MDKKSLRTILINIALGAFILCSVSISEAIKNPALVSVLNIIACIILCMNNKDKQKEDNWRTIWNNGNKINRVFFIGAIIIGILISVGIFAELLFR